MNQKNDIELSGGSWQFVHMCSFVGSLVTTFVLFWFWTFSSTEIGLLEEELDGKTSEGCSLFGADDDSGFKGGDGWDWVVSFSGFELLGVEVSFWGTDGSEGIGWTDRGDSVELEGIVEFEDPVVLLPGSVWFCDVLFVICVYFGSS